MVSGVHSTVDMLQLPDDVQTAFLDEQFAVKRSLEKFNAVWSDIGTETTIIRDAKGRSGIVGLTRKQPALIRRSLTRHIMGEYRSAMKDRSRLQTIKSEILPNKSVDVFTFGETRSSLPCWSWVVPGW